MRMIVYTLLFVAVSCIGCNAFQHGYTQQKSENVYQLVTWNKKDPGTKRLKMHRQFHKKSGLSCFMDNHAKPDFMLEYRDEEKREVIHLYYATTDSVFIFKECKQNQSLCVVLQETRTLSNKEKQIYETLQKGTAIIKRS